MLIENWKMIYDGYAPIDCKAPCSMYGVLLEKGLMVGKNYRDNAIKLTGEEDNLDKASEVIGILLKILERGEEIDEQKILYAITMVQENGGVDLKLLGEDCIAVSHRGTPIKTKTLGQKKYCEL